ncbi:hypothetical protein IV203_011913 [Nitzschia inconspicua]|uniref:Uncharacterized protein n=1 Tax=Nitzschia inconspicua TaxID=303405 RepID=A0A9K3PJQ4_9STRA|nr:hypothetical protein IV203_011913 [Nitzschia inconspicua]
MAFDRDVSHPIIRHTGGRRRDWLRKGTYTFVEYRFDEINLNLGCQSHRVEEGRMFRSFVFTVKQVDVAEQAVQFIQEPSFEYDQRSVPEGFLDEFLVAAEESRIKYLKRKGRSTKSAASLLSRLMPFVMILLVLLSHVSCDDSIATMNRTKNQALKSDQNALQELVVLDVEQNSNRESDPGDSDFRSDSHEGMGPASSSTAETFVVVENKKVPVVTTLFETELERNEVFHQAIGMECLRDPSYLDQSHTIVPMKEVPSKASIESGGSTRAGAEYPGDDMNTLISCGDPQWIDSTYPREAERLDRIAQPQRLLDGENVNDIQVNSASGSRGPGALEGTIWESSWDTKAGGVYLESENWGDFESVQCSAGEIISAYVKDGISTNDKGDVVLDLDVEEAPVDDTREDQAASVTKDLSPFSDEENNETEGDIGFEGLLLKSVPIDSSGSTKSNGNGGNPPKGSLASFYESASNFTSMKSSAHQLEEQKEQSTSSCEPMDLANERKVHYRGEPWGYYRPTRRIPDRDLLLLLFEDVKPEEKDDPRNSTKRPEPSKGWKKDLLSDDYHVHDFSDMSGEETVSKEGRNGFEERFVTLYDPIVSEASDANSHFVEGLDDIEKFFEGVDPPDELDVGASGLSIQEVLVGKGRQILLKKILQFSNASRASWERLVDRFGKLFTRSQEEQYRSNFESHPFPALKQLAGMPIKAWHISKIGIEKLFLIPILRISRECPNKIRRLLSFRSLALHGLKSSVTGQVLFRRSQNILLTGIDLTETR